VNRNIGCIAATLDELCWRIGGFDMTALATILFLRLLYNAPFVFNDVDNFALVGVVFPLF